MTSAFRILCRVWLVPMALSNVSYSGLEGIFPASVGLINYMVGVDAGIVICF